MSMLQAIVSFLIFLNPIALFLYLLPLKKEVGLRKFINIVARASFITYLIFFIFAVSGDRFFQALSVNFEAFRIFGGIVVASLSLIFIINGKKSLIRTTGELNRIAAEIALPFMVGAGTITLSIIVGQQLGAVRAATAIFIVMFLTFLTICIFAMVRNSLNSRFKVVFDQNADILLRINSFIIGAIAVDLIAIGIKNLFGLS
jgi:multiple antibiotic resistance protein